MESLPRRHAGTLVIGSLRQAQTTATDKSPVASSSGTTKPAAVRLARTCWIFYKRLWFIEAQSPRLILSSGASTDSYGTSSYLDQSRFVEHTRIYIYIYKVNFWPRSQQSELPLELEKSLNGRYGHLLQDFVRVFANEKAGVEIKLSFKYSNKLSALPKRSNDLKLVIFIYTAVPILWCEMLIYYIAASVTTSYSLFSICILKRKHIFAIKKNESHRTYSHVKQLNIWGYSTVSRKEAKKTKAIYSRFYISVLFRNGPASFSCLWFTITVTRKKSHKLTEPHSSADATH